MPAVYAFAAHFRYVIALLFLTAFVTAIFQFQRTSVDLLPEFNPPYVEIQTEALGLSAEEVEALITVPMEVDLMNGVSWVETITSRSMPGLSSVLLTFEPGTDLFRARQMVQERMTQAHALPNVSKPPVMMQPVSSTSRILQVAMSSEKYSLIDLSVAARWILRPRLLGVPGVANVSIWGQRQRQLHIQVDPQKLHEADVSLQQVINTSGNALWFSPLTFLNASTPGSGGFIDTPNQRLTVQHLQPISTPKELSQVAIEGTGKTLGEIASISENHPPLIGDAVVDGGKGIVLIVEKFPWSDTIEVTRNVEEALVTLGRGLPDVELDASLFRPATFLEEASRAITTAVLLGFLVAVVCVFLLNRSWRRTVIIASSAVASFALSFSILRYLGGGFDLIALTGLLAASGAVFSDAILAGRAARLEAAGGTAAHGPNPVEIGYSGSRTTAAFSAVALLLLAAPILFLEGFDRSMGTALFVPFAVTIAASFATSLLLTPALASILPAGRRSGDNRPAPRAEAREDDPAFLRALKIPVLSATAALAAVAVLTFSLLDRSLAPTFNERDILINWSARTGTSNEEMFRLASQAVRELKMVPGVTNAGANIGRAIVSDKVQDVDSAELWVNIDQSADRSATLRAVEEVAYGYPGVRSQVLNYSGEKIRKPPQAADNELLVRIYGYEANILNSLAEQLRSEISAIGGISSTAIVRSEDQPVIQIKVDLEKAKIFGLKPGDIRRTSAVLLAGLEVGNLFEQQKVFDVIVWGTPDVRRSVTSVEELLIETPTGQPVRLAEVADVTVSSMPAVIERDASSRFIDVRAVVDQGKISDVAQSISATLSEIKFPLEFHAEVIGDSVASEATRARVKGLMLLSLVGLLLIAQAAFARWSLAAAVVVSTLAAMSGGVFAAAFLGGLSLGAVAGLLAGLAIALPCLMMQIHRYQVAERAGAPPSEFLGLAAVRRSAWMATAPVLVAVAFLLPALILSGRPGLEVIAPMTWVALGTSVTTLLVALLVLPILYRGFGIGSAQENEQLFADRPIEGGVSHAT